jgi:hypothetical protein
VAGYCDGDFVVTASEKGGKWEWGPTAWGGKGDEPGKFQTAHGIFAYDNHIFVANREAHQVIEFTPEGKLVRCLPDIPDTARICNVARADNYFVFNALEPIQHTPAKVSLPFHPVSFSSPPPSRVPLFCLCRISSWDLWHVSRVNILR